MRAARSRIGHFSYPAVAAARLAHIEHAHFSPCQRGTPLSARALACPQSDSAVRLGRSLRDTGTSLRSSLIRCRSHRFASALGHCVAVLTGPSVAPANAASTTWQACGPPCSPCPPRGVGLALAAPSTSLRKTKQLRRRRTRWRRVGPWSVHGEHEHGHDHGQRDLGVMRHSVAGVDGGQPAREVSLAGHRQAGAPDTGEQGRGRRARHRPG